MSGERRPIQLSATWTIETQQEAEVAFHPELATQLLEILQADMKRRSALINRLAPVHPTEVFPLATLSP